MPENKKGKKKIARKKPARSKKTRHIAVQSNGMIRFRATFGELKAFAESSPYRANRAILRAAVSRLKATGVPDGKITDIAFGMSPPHRP